MNQTQLTVPNISCGHCVMSIRNELSGIRGVQDISGDPASRTITVQWESPASLDEIRRILEEIGYPAQ